MSFCGFKTEGFSRWSSVDWWVKVSMNALLFNSALIILYFTGLLAFEHVLFLRSTRQTARHISGFYIKLPFARLLRSSLRISTWRLHSSLLRLLFQHFHVTATSRLQSSDSPRRLILCCFCDPFWLTLLFPARFCCIGRTPAHSDGYPSLDTAWSQYSIGSCRLILSCTLRYCISPCYWSDVQGFL